MSLESLKQKSSEELAKLYQETESNKILFILYERHFHMGCKFAVNFLNGIKYSNLIQYQKDEINSYVYLSFHKAITKFRQEFANKMSFKNFFYQMIKFDSYYELKNNFNWSVVTNFKNLSQTKEWLEVDYTPDLNQARIEILVDYLATYNPFYGKIFLAKAQGCTLQEIAQSHNLTVDKVKNQYRYAKRLILQKYKTISDVI